jgi:hypothetical protein
MWREGLQFQWLGVCPRRAAFSCEEKARLSALDRGFFRIPEPRFPAVSFDRVISQLLAGAL